MLPLTSFLVRSPLLSRGYSRGPMLPSPIRALIYQGSEYGNNVQAFFPDHGFIVTKYGVFDSDKPFNRIELPLNESESYEVETEIFERELCDEKIKSIFQAIVEFNKQKKDGDRTGAGLNDFTTERGQAALRINISNLLKDFGEVPTGLERGGGGLF